ncbi:MAG: hemerythrin domain-containing protein [Ginsengibacter sp.]
MNTNPLAETESTVVNERYHALEFLKNKDVDLNQVEPNITGEYNNEFYVNTEPVKSVLQPFKVFKPLLRNDFGKWETNFLVDYIIKTHHEFAKKNAVAIFTLAQKVAYQHSDNHPELLTLNKIIFLLLHDLLNQMSKEEQSLFPYIRQIAKDKRHSKINSIPQSLKGEIKLLQNEHAKAVTYLKVLRQVTNNFRIPSDACNSYNTLFEKLKELEDDLNIHFHLEDDILFPKAISDFNQDLFIRK